MQEKQKLVNPWRHVLTATYVAAALAIPVYAGQVAGLHIFQSGQPARASDVNENFETLKIPPIYNWWFALQTTH